MRNVALLAILAIGLTGCSASLTTLQVIVDSTEAAIPILQAAGVAVPTEVALYIGDVAACIGNTSGATAAQLTSISACLTGKVAPQLTGLPSAVVSIVGIVIQDVQKFLVKAPAMTASVQAKGVTVTQANQVAAMQVKARTTSAVARSMVKK